MRHQSLRETAEKEGWKELTDQEATHIHLTEPSIIVSPGRTNIHDGEGGYYYLAMGPIPNSLRGGPSTTSFAVFNGPYYQINLKTLVRMNGFYPSFFANGPLMRYQGNATDYSVNFDALIHHTVDGPYTKEELHSSSVIQSFWDSALGKSDKRNG